MTLTSGRMPYTPSQELLQRYARLLVDYALGGGSGIKPGDVVHINAPDSATKLGIVEGQVGSAGGRNRADLRRLIMLRAALAWPRVPLPWSGRRR